MELIEFAQYLIEILKKYPFDAKRQIALNLLDRFIKHLKGEKMPVPTQDELNTLIDVIKEIKQKKALSYAEYNQVEKDAEFIKQLVDWWQKEQQVKKTKEVAKNDL